MTETKLNKKKLKMIDGWMDMLYSIFSKYILEYKQNILDSWYNSNNNNIGKNNNS